MFLSNHGQMIQFQDCWEQEELAFTSKPANLQTENNTMLNLIINFLWDFLRPKHDLLLENIALRQQILVLQRQVKRPKFRDRERAFWVVLSRYWSGWKSPLRLVQPQTVVSWHRRSWRLFWKWKSRPKDYARPTVPLEVINLIRKMSLENPLWGAPRIYGDRVLETIKFLNIHDKVISARSPWQNGYCERVVGTIKREFLHHMIIFNESHARRLLKKHFEYYHEDRTHLGLEKETPSCRKVEPRHLGLVKRRPMAGGLHSRYFREAA